MPGLEPGIHVLVATAAFQNGVDGRDKSGHDVESLADRT
jgi:hypothetical protein